MDVWTRGGGPPCDLQNVIPSADPIVDLCACLERRNVGREELLPLFPLDDVEQICVLRLLDRLLGRTDRPLIRLRSWLSNALVCPLDTLGEGMGLDRSVSHKTCAL